MTGKQAFACEVHRDGSRVSVIVEGEVDAATTDRLQSELTNAINRDGVTAAAVDLSGVTFLDSSGLRALIIGKHAADSVGIAYTVDRLNPAVERLLEVAGLLEYLSVSDAGD